MIKSELWAAAVAAAPRFDSEVMDVASGAAFNVLEAGGDSDPEMRATMAAAEAVVGVARSRGLIPDRTLGSRPRVEAAAAAADLVYPDILNARRAAGDSFAAAHSLAFDAAHGAALDVEPDHELALRGTLIAAAAIA